MNVEGNRAEVNISISFNNTKFTALVYVDTANRSVTLLNGTDVGTTYLWVPANPNPDEVKILGTMATPQGQQKAFLEGNGDYDLDTGVLIHSDFVDEPTLLAVGIVRPGFYGTSGIFSATNIDLGPREWLPEIIMAIPYVLPVVAFIIVLIFLFRKRQEKSRRQRALAAKKKRKSHPAVSNTYVTMSRVHRLLAPNR